MFDFINPWGWLAALSLPALVFIYLFRRQPKLRRVSSLFLWKLLRPPETPGPKLQRFQADLLLLLQLLALAGLTVALAQPIIQRTRRVQRHWVVLDLSASMAARDVNGRTAWEKAVAKLTEEIRRQGAGAQWAWVEARPDRRASGFLEASEALAQLAKLAPSESEDCLPPAVAFATDGAARTDAIWVVTDHLQPSTEDVRIGRWMSFGEPQPNAAWLGAQRQLTERGERLVASLVAHGTFTAPTRIECRAGQETLGSLSVTTTNRQAAVVEFEVPPARKSADLTLRLVNVEDALRLDDTVVVPPPPARQVLVELALDQGPVRASVERVLEALPCAVTVKPPSTTDLRIEPATASMSSNLVASSTLVLGPLPAEPSAKPLTLIGPYLVERHHPLLDGVELDGVLFGGVTPSAPKGMRASLVLAGDIPILFQRDSAQEQWVWNADLQRSTVLRSEAWPIFLQNLVERVRDGLPGFARNLYSCAESIEVRPAATWMGKTAIFNGTTRLTFRDQTSQTLPPTGCAGELMVDEGRLARVRIAMLASPESDLRAAGTQDWKSPRQSSAEITAQQDYSEWFAVLVLGLMGVDWLWFRRRRRVGSRGLHKLE